jgi:Tol biopolymer transport system component
MTSFPTQQALTQEGTILGTFQYMAPEQLEGREADARTDIFAFGTLLYEISTGQKAFSGRTQASLIAAIIERVPPPISTISPMTPPAFDRVVKTCLEKDPEDRWQTAHDVMLELKWIAEGGSAAGAPVSVVAARKGRERLAWAAAAVFLLSSVALTVAYFRRPSSPARARPIHLQVAAPSNADFGGAAEISPDGNWLAFTATSSDGSSALWVRPLDSPAARLLPGTGEASQPFWSPDSRALGFFAGRKLKTIELSGGAVQVLHDVSGDVRGGAWAQDGTIVFSPSFLSSLLRISSAGGPVRPATTLDPARREQTHRFPSFLPDGRRFLYFASPGSGEEPGSILLGSLDGDKPVLLLQSSSLARFASSGHLLFARGKTLLAQAFDPTALRLTGRPFAVAEPVASFGAMSGFRVFSVSDTGILVYKTGAVQDSRLVWLDRSGRELAALGSPGNYYAPRLSPDGTRVAAAKTESESNDGDIWLTDLSRNVTSRFTFSEADDSTPVWSPDGRRVFFTSSREGVSNLYQVRPDQPGREEIVLRTTAWKVPDDVSPDGRFLVYETSDPKTRIDLWILPLSGDRTPAPLVTSPFDEFAAQFSPDGRWIAYTSNESGRGEVYVQSFPGPGGKWQVSAAGGGTPRWTRDRKQLLYYGSDGRLMAAAVRLAPAFEASAPVPLFKVALLEAPDRQYEVSHDGSRILANVVVGGTESLSRPLNVVVDWHAGGGNK